MAVQPNVDNKKDCFLFLQDREFLANCHISDQQTTHRTPLTVFYLVCLQNCFSFSSYSELHT